MFSHLSAWVRLEIAFEEEPHPSEAHLQPFGKLHPKQERLEHWPDLLITPVFAENIRRVLRSGQVMECENSSGNRFSNSVIGKDGVPFV